MVSFRNHPVWAYVVCVNKVYNSHYQATRVFSSVWQNRDIRHLYILEHGLKAVEGIKLDLVGFCFVIDTTLF